MFRRVCEAWGCATLCAPAYPVVIVLVDWKLNHKGPARSAAVLRFFPAQ
jgi:hypothetical protein